MPRPTFRVPLRQSSGQPRTARSLSALGIELHGLASYPEALALAQARSFLRFQSDLKQGRPFEAEYYGLGLSIAERCAGASVARFIRCERLSTEMPRAR